MISTTDNRFHTQTRTDLILYTRALDKSTSVGRMMPGMIFHMMAYATAGRSPILAALNDAAPITGCVRWEETHDRRLLEPLWDFLCSNEGEDIRQGMENHLLVDEYLHGEGTPLYPSIVRIADNLNHTAAFQTSHQENHARLAELVVETSLDGLVSETNENLFNTVVDSHKRWDPERVSALFSRFFQRDRNAFRQGFDSLRSIDLRSITCINGIARSWMITYGSAMQNLSYLEPEQSFKPWYEYLTRCFSVEETMKALTQFEESARTELEATQHEILAALDSHRK